MPDCDVCIEWRCRNVDEKWKWKPSKFSRTHTHTGPSQPFSYSQKSSGKKKERRRRAMFCVRIILVAEDKIMTLYITFLVDWSLNDNKLSWELFILWHRILDDIYTSNNAECAWFKLQSSSLLCFKWTSWKLVTRKVLYVNKVDN